MARNIYMTDGSPEGFFTAVFDGWRDKDAFIASSRAVQTALGDEFIPVPPDAEKAARVVRKLRRIDNACLYEIDCVLRTPDADREQAAFSYIRLLMAEKKPVRGMLTRPEVRRVRELSDRVGQERHRLTDFCASGRRRTACITRPAHPTTTSWNFSCPISRRGSRPFPSSSTTFRGASRAYATAGNGRSSPPRTRNSCFRRRKRASSGFGKNTMLPSTSPSRRNVRQQKATCPCAIGNFSPKTPANSRKAAELSDFAPHNPFFRQNLPPFDFFHPLYSLASCQKEEYNR